MKIVANIILFGLLAWLAISAIGFWWLVGAALVWIIAQIADNK